MLVDELEAQLAELENNAPLTAEPNEAAETQAVEGGEPIEGQQQDEWKPPTKEHWENLEKARRADRDQLREQRRQNQLYEQNIQRMQERFAQFQNQMVQQRLQAPAPDPYENPEAARAWQQQQQQFQNQLFQAEQQRQQQIAQQQQQDREFQYVESEVNSFEADFKQQHPDYDDATDHLLGIQQKILEGMGYPPNVAAEQVALWSMNVARQAISSRRNPAQVAYELAQQMGYQKKVPGGQTAQEAAANKIAQIRAGQAAAQTISGGGSGGQTAGPSLKQIASLEGAAFDSAMEKYLNTAIRG